MYREWCNLSSAIVQSWCPVGCSLFFGAVLLFLREIFFSPLPIHVYTFWDINEISGRTVVCAHRYLRTINQAPPWPGRRLFFRSSLNFHFLFLYEGCRIKNPNLTYYTYIFEKNLVLKTSDIVIMHWYFQFFKWEMNLFV